MPPGIPHSAVVNENIKSYLNEGEKRAGKLAKKLSNSPEYVGAFRNSIAAYSVLAKLARGNRLGLMNTAASIVRRCPFLLAFGQMSMAYIDLRRFLETVSRYPYFHEHPIEWKRILDDPEVGTLKDDSDPIAWCAAREQKWYVNYIKVRFPDKSGLIELALSSYVRLYKELSAHVHISKDAASQFNIKNVVQTPSAAAIKEFREKQREVYVAGLITSLAVNPSQLNKLPAVERAWMEWLLGSAKSKALVSGSFLT
jgi:hypothetical protein